MRKWIHPLVLRLVRQQKKHELHILSCYPLIARKAIFAMNHSRVYDFPYAAEIIKHHTFALVGKQRLNLMDRIAFGVIYMDRKSKSSKTFVKSKMKELILNGQHYVCFRKEHGI